MDWNGVRTPTVLLPPSEHGDYQHRTGLDGRNFEVTGSDARLRFREFFRNYQTNNVFVYRDLLLRRWGRREFFVEVDLSHLNEYDEILFNNVQTKPEEMMQWFERGAKDALVHLLTSQNAESAKSHSVGDFQVILHGSQITHSLRTLTAEHINKLVKIPGIIISCTKSKSKATCISLQCSKCGNQKKVDCKSSMGSFTVPVRCEKDSRQSGESCGPGSYVIMADKCEFVDQQMLKLQECPESVPTGEMPRNILLAVDRYLVDRVSPGTRVSVIAVASLYSTGERSKLAISSIRTPYLRVLGIQLESESGGRDSVVYTPQEESELQRLSKDTEIYEKIARSIAPQISGEYTKDIKKALACLLMGGSRKVLPDGVKLRGDINVLLMGDPSTAKSQFLKFIERIAPVAVYTSGKGSSAAGLTASVIRDSRGEFFLEGGAMVLADGGVICIDEFDKMRETDRVAIHEAMEQQTISIAKAGITCVLNSRVSVLAAANPVHGRYDDLKSIGDNIDLMATILSRFDCIFIVRDIKNAERDREIAHHVMGVHINAAMSEVTPEGDIDMATLKKYVCFCRERCAPRLNDAAAAMLNSQYVQVRNQARLNLANSPGQNQVVPITIRQLEALIRLSESLAKMRLSSEATEMDVEEALRLFNVSTLATSLSNPAIFGLGESSDAIKRSEEYLRRRLGLRLVINSKQVIEEAQLQGYSNESLKHAIAAMVLRREVVEKNQGKLLMRVC